MLRTNFYIDGFNLYFRALRGTPYRWLDLDLLCRNVLPHNAVNQIKYFTALIDARPDDPTQPMRQQSYLRALRTLPAVTIVLGHFMSKPRTMPLVTPSASSRFAEVWRTEEKGSDVNLVVHLLRDGFRNEYDAAAIVTNDSDFVEAIRIVKEDLGKTVVVVNPDAQHGSVDLRKHASMVRDLRTNVLARSQFPDAMSDAHGTFHKPAGW